MTTKKNEPELLTAELVSDPVPGPGQRVGRSFSQGGGALVVVQVVQAFGWLGSGEWTAEQAAQRWPALTAALLLAFSVGQNLFNWWRSERRTGLSAVTVTADDKGHGEAYTLLVVALVVLLVFALLGRL